MTEAEKDDITDYPRWVVFRVHRVAPAQQVIAPFYERIGFWPINDYADAAAAYNAARDGNADPQMGFLLTRVAKLHATPVTWFAGN